jgi:hypothetical protein
VKAFDGKSLGDPAPSGGGEDGGMFDQFAGATITPRAVVKAVKGGLDFLPSTARKSREADMSNDYRSIIKEGLWDQNVVFSQMLACVRPWRSPPAAPTAWAWGWRPPRCWWSPTCWCR